MKVLEGMAFAGFVSERGVPYRSTDLFDEVQISSLPVYVSLPQPTQLTLIIFPCSPLAGGS